MDESLRLIDLVPRRLTTFGLLLLAALTIVVGLEALHAWLPELAAKSADGRIAAFDLGGDGSLAVWFSSLTFGLAGLASVAVYTVRRYKTDDYRGFYRVWLWAALCCLWMSVDRTANLHQAFAGAMIQATGTRVYGDGSVWWVVPYAFLLAAVVSRLVVDMRHCRLSTAALFLAASGFTVAALVRFGWVMPSAGASGVMVGQGAQLAGSVFLLLAIGLYARYVLLDAEGLLPRRECKAEEQDDEELAEEELQAEPSAANADRWLAVDPPHSTPPPAGKRKAASVPSEPEASPVTRKLTKQERKALQAKQLRERIQRERQQSGGWSEGK